MGPKWANASACRLRNSSLHAGLEWRMAYMMSLKDMIEQELMARKSELNDDFARLLDENTEMHAVMNTLAITRAEIDALNTTKQLLADVGEASVAIELYRKSWEHLRRAPTDIKLGSFEHAIECVCNRGWLRILRTGIFALLPSCPRPQGCPVSGVHALLFSLMGCHPFAGSDNERLCPAGCTMRSSLCPPSGFDDGSQTDS